MEHTGQDVHECSADECWELLQSRAFGRLAFAVDNRPEIVPINYVTADRRIYFRTAAGSKLFGLTVNRHVAFEIDDVGEDSALATLQDADLRGEGARHQLADPAVVAGAVGARRRS